MQELIIATTNEGKLKEFKELMKDMDVELKSLKECADIPAPEETGRPVNEIMERLNLIKHHI